MRKEWLNEHGRIERTGEKRGMRRDGRRRDKKGEVESIQEERGGGQGRRRGE